MAKKNFSLQCIQKCVWSLILIIMVLCVLKFRSSDYLGTVNASSTDESDDICRTDTEKVGWQLAILYPPQLFLTEEMGQANGHIAALFPGSLLMLLLFICFYCLFVFVFCSVYCSEKT